MLAKSKDADLIWESYTQPEADDIVTEEVVKEQQSAIEGIKVMEGVFGNGSAPHIKAYIEQGIEIPANLIANAQQHFDLVRGLGRGGGTMGYDTVMNKLKETRAGVVAKQQAGQGVSGIWNWLAGLPLWAQIAGGAAVGVGGYYGGKKLGLWGKEEQPLQANHSPLNTTAPGIS